MGMFAHHGKANGGLPDPSPIATTRSPTATRAARPRRPTRARLVFQRRVPVTRGVTY